MDDMAIDTGKPLNSRNLKSMAILEKVNVRPTLDTSWEALKDQRKIPHGLYLFSKEEPKEAILHYLQRLKDEGVDISEFRLSELPDKAPNFQLASSIPLPTPLYTPSETPPSTTRTSQPLPKFNLDNTSLPLSEAEQMNETTSSSSAPESPPYCIISSDTEFYDPTSPTLAHLQTQNLASQQPQQPPPEPEVTSPPPTEQPTITPSDVQPSDPNTSDLTPPNTSVEPQIINLSPPTSSPLPSEPEHSLPALEEAIVLFA
ncbi:hypothetical protein KIW84_023495 [Lathyrus oleraceus]|uniref:Uncharacterized protein n=1 Tax=Pisum sativum TaxID=3888 RepID=A0A9D4YD43_PEA|nr:hypothetical protein KIW84_023495 [Pisum sativum]